MRSTLPTDVPPYFCTINAMGDLSGVAVARRRAGATTAGSEATERKRRVRAAEAEGIGQRRADRHVARDAWHEVQVAARILLEEIRRRRRNLVFERQDGEDGLDPARGAQQVPGHRLRRADGDLLRPA